MISYYLRLARKARLTKQWGARSLWLLKAWRLSHKLDWATLTPEQRRLFLAIKKKHERYERLRIVK